MKNAFRAIRKHYRRSFSTILQVVILLTPGEWVSG
jgi:hypothetical protein